MLIDVHVHHSPRRYTYAMARYAGASRSAGWSRQPHTHSPEDVDRRLQLEIPELRDLLDQYAQARHRHGDEGPNQVTLQASCYLAETAERAEPNPSTARS